MAKTSRFKFAYRDNASSLHKKVGEILRNSSVFKYHQSYQEYPVNRVNPEYQSGREHFDWCIPSLKFVCEVHGQQHYQKVNWGGMSDERAQELFEQQVERDRLKREAAISAGWTYIAIPWNVPITESRLVSEYQANFNDTKPPERDIDRKDSDWVKKNKEKARDYRRVQYQKAKAAKKAFREQK